MKLHLPLALSRALFASFAALALTQISSGATSESYPNGSITYTTQLTNFADLYGHESILFEDIIFESGGRYVKGGAICYDDGWQRIADNGAVTFSGNTASASASTSEYVNVFANGGAIYNNDSFTLSDNGAVTFSGNTASAFASPSGYSNVFANGGAIDNVGTFTLSGNGAVTFSGNTATASYSVVGGAIYNYDDATFSLSGNGDVTFSGNTASAFAFARGCAIANDGTFKLSDNGNVTFRWNTVSADGELLDGTIANRGTFTLSDNGDVTFSGNTASSSAASSFASAGSGAIGNSGTFTLSGNGNVTFSGNTASASASEFSEFSEFSEASAGCGAIANDGTFTLSGNGNVTFSGNTASASVSSEFSEVSAASAGSGAIGNGGTFTLSGNGAVTFSGNTAAASVSDSYASAGSGAIGNSGTFTLSGNGAVTFSGNTAAASAYDSHASAYGGAIGNFGTFTLSGNGAVTFSGNTAAASAYDSHASAYGGAINNDRWGTFTLSGNGDVLFEKNAEISNGTYRLRSIYSAGNLYLSASEGKSILFKDSVYAKGEVNLNQGGKGDIIFTGVSTEADLREVKGGIDGTAAEILNSRTSEIATNASLYGGRLIVEAGAILMGQGITVTEGANATIRLNDATLDETGYAIAVSSGSGLEFEGENVLKAASVQMADGAFLSFVMGEGVGSDWDAQLTTGQLHVQVSGDLFNAHQLLTLADASQYDTGSWTSDSVTVSGASFDSLRWEAGVLTYTPHVITPGEDGTLDDVLPDDGHAVIDGNGHTLTVKNEVQLVQMALKDGIVRLEGENNGIVSVTLTEGGELVLSAGAGLTTGDIISMVASGKGELVISGDITLDNKGMKGKEGKHATVSHADMQVQGDASISHVRVEDSTIDVAEGCTVNFAQVVLAATARLTDEPATAVMDEVTAELMMGVNTSKMADGVLSAGAVLVQNGNTAQTLSPEAEATVVQLEATTFDSLTLTGSSLVLELRGLETELYNGADYIALSFTSGKSYATFEDGLAVLLSTDGEHYAQGHYLQGGDHTTLYFDIHETVTPEPTTATLSLLALAALAARRRRK